MSLKVKLIIIFVLFILMIISYLLAKKYKNKKILISTYVLFGFLTIMIIYLLLGLIIVGGFWHHFKIML